MIENEKSEGQLLQGVSLRQWFSTIVVANDKAALFEDG